MSALELILNRQARAEVEMAELRAQQTKTLRRLDGLGKIVATGVKMLVKFAKESRERDRVTHHKLELLIRSVDRLVDSLRYGRNGGGR